jgi:hypothetical protein
LVLRAQLDEEPGIEQEITLRRHLAPSPLVAVLADQPIPMDGIQARTVHVAGDSLPFHNAGFAPMDLVVIHRDSLKGLTRQQLVALQQHAAQCGRIVIVGFTSAAMAKFADFAGCGGRFLVAAETEADLDTHVASLLGAPVSQLPSPANLHALLENNGMARQVPQLVAFFAIYLGVLLLVLIAVRGEMRSTYFVLASTAATLIGLTAWTVNPGYVERVVWTEMENTAGVARFTSILGILGDGGRLTIDVTTDAGPLKALQPMGLEFTSDRNGDRAASVSFDTRLFSQHELVASGVTLMSAPLIVEHSEDVPRITNAGSGESPPALLAWNDLKYSVPPLAPNADWRASSEPEPWGTNRAEQLFRQRAMRETAALLFEYPTSSLQPAGTERTYLMVRP